LQSFLYCSWLINRQQRLAVPVMPGVEVQAVAVEVVVMDTHVSAEVVAVANEISKEQQT
jgi:hypothetical protein